MIRVKTAHEAELMRRAGRITAAARELAGKMVVPGVTTLEIDKAVIKGSGSHLPELRRLSEERVHLDKRRGDPRDTG